MNTLCDYCHEEGKPTTVCWTPENDPNISVMVVKGDREIGNEIMEAGGWIRREICEQCLVMTPKESAKVLDALGIEFRS